MRKYYAHSLDGEPPEKWQLVESHLNAVSGYSSEFASAFGASQWGLCLGRFHDLGKYNPDFQSYLLNQNGLLPAGMRAPARVDHSTFGARLAYERMDRFAGGLLAYIIAGHHAGLPDYAAEVESGSTIQSSLSGRLKLRADALPDIPSDLPTVSARDVPSWFNGTVRDADGAFRVSLFTRMLFSCLVDADWLDTEAFCEPAKAAKRRAVARPEIAEIERRLASHMGGFSNATGLVNERRREVLLACMEKAAEAPGLFSLTVPTGGGKTLASLSFALRHALKHGMRRVIYVIPYTSIIEQTADVFRKAAGEDAVLEHHCNFDPEKRKKADESDGRKDADGDLRYRFLSDNWDAPIVVTTNVQFYESLFSAHPGRCRKLHNIAQSVIIFDEAQSLPVEYLRACLQLLRELVHGYGCSAVLCTATQPALDKAEYFPIGFTPKEVRPIVADPVGLYDALRRVEVVREALPLDTSTLVKRLSAPENERVLCIVNKRKHAAELFEALRGELGPEAGVFHLSALMCPMHRTVVLDEIKKRMNDKVTLPPCRVISTSLVEAGVDLDFPVVYRAMAGVDSIAQAAGRCNREGRMSPAKGRVFVFEPAEEDYAPKGSVIQAAETAKGAMRLHADPLSLECVKSYFGHYYETRNMKNWDDNGVMGAATLSKSAGLIAQFRLIEKKFRLINDGQVTIVVPWGEEGDALCKRIRDERFPLDYADFRKAQRYSVGIPQKEFDALLGEGGVQVFREGRFNVLVNENAYDPVRGLNVAKGGILDVAGTTNL